ncbi:LysR family transcriptional regulator [Acidithiobacillus sp.]|jgi:DNA-binding transcriptional LysR family regulator|uniref:LysR family transcriptional regulator n=1 Tax=Acidithiobacillus sp. TaxID=1872118 RepID=UPI0025C28F1E|nr:LysR family transcriptional regulator [Acidithiobacillus sp.]MCK9188164.1 LysR family transcriptional regulator [Acidithiobacillus sp.]MCK9360312.1 LysR family transcriptional regulator [Acidithiobacillus sp.]
MTIDAEQLLTLLAVAETGSVSEAALRLGRGQPAISERLHKLTREIGEPLYVREGGGIQLTPAGQALIPDIRQLRAKLQDIENLLMRQKSLQSGELRIASTSLIANYLLPQYLQIFQKQNPGVNLFIKSGVAYWEHINLSELDVFFFEGEMDIPHLPDSYEIQPWLTGEIIAVMPKTHPLASASALSLKDVQPFPVVWREPSSGVRRILEKAFRKKNILPAHFIEVADVESVGAMVKAGLGIGFMTRTVFEQRPDWDLISQPIISSQLIWQSYMAIPNSARRSRTLSVFLDIMD